MQQTIFLLRVLVTFIITIIATVQDLKSYKIKNELIIGAFVAGGMCTVLNLLNGGDVKDYIFGMVAVFLITFILFLIRGIGAGDAKLLTVMGFIIGYKMTIKIILVSLILGLLIGVASIVFKQHFNIKKGVLSIYGDGVSQKMVNYHIFHFSPAILIAQAIIFTTSFIN